MKEMGDSAWKRHLSQDETVGSPEALQRSNEASQSTKSVNFNDVNYIDVDSIDVVTVLTIPRNQPRPMLVH
jgi:hypothetical protein